MNKCIFLCFIFITACNAANFKQTNTLATTTPTETRYFEPENMTQVLFVLPWNPFYANQLINQGCKWDDPAGVCEESISTFTQTNCKMLKHFKTPVCGATSCYYNSTTGKCGGQCSNTVLETCVSRSRNPTQNSDCVCASSAASFTSNFDSRTGVTTIDIPTCDASTCYGNTCSFKYVSVNRVSDGQLYGFCNNENIHRTGCSKK
jgi:hypothetical protein